MSIRNKAGKIIANLLIKSGWVNRTARQIKASDQIIALCFHYPNRHLFETCIKWLRDHDFHFISTNDLEAIAAGKQTFPKGAVIITLDDGWQGNVTEVIPVAKKYGVPIEVYVSTGPVENGDAYWWSYVGKARAKGLIRENAEYYKQLPNDERLTRVNALKSQLSLGREAMTIEELREISHVPEVSLGSHTVTHPILPCCSNATAKQEILASKNQLEEWIEKPVLHFAYPNGDYTTREITLLKKFGYTLAFSIEQRFITPERLKNCYTLPRFMMVESVSVEENICRMLGCWPIAKAKKKIFYP